MKRIAMLIGVGCFAREALRIFVRALPMVSMDDIAHQLAFSRPGISPRQAISRKQIRHRPNRR